MSPSPSTSNERRFYSAKWLVAVSMFLMSAMLVLAGCGEKPEPVPEPADVAPVAPDPVKVEEAPEEPEFPFAYSLTGMGTEQEVKDRPVMVMVENSPRARPQSGLDQADIVFEILAEGDITRFVAVYQSKSPEVIGPVRSIRPYFVEIGDGLDALIVHAGWSQEAMNILKSRQLPHFDQVYGDHAYYWRDNSRKAPHNLYTSIELIRDGAEDKKYREEWNEISLKFKDTESEEAGISAKEADIHYIGGYYVSYEYDETTKQYQRSMLGEPHNDKESGEQLTASNIIICEAPHRVLDNVGRRSVDVFGPGNGKLIQEGKVQDVTWEHKGGIIRAYIDGKEAALVPGTTWIHVVPTGSNIEIEG